MLQRGQCCQYLRVAIDVIATRDVRWLCTFLICDGTSKTREQLHSVLNALSPSVNHTSRKFGPPKGCVEPQLTYAQLQGRVGSSWPRSDRTLAVSNCCFSGTAAKPALATARQVSLHSEKARSPELTSGCDPDERSRKGSTHSLGVPEMRAGVSGGGGHRRKLRYSGPSGCNVAP